MDIDLREGLQRLRRYDETRASAPFEHVLVGGLGLWLLNRRASSLPGALLSRLAGVALLARAVTGRDGLLAMVREEFSGAGAGDAADADAAAARSAPGDSGYVAVASPWPHDQPVRVAPGDVPPLR